ncbi:hypothetical protein C5167_023350 [Papaver somniferum]|uniref:Uncharacterized protein n=1 Tax=Papaver somniferum TaxID=3469 RepID=A0A4Y7JLG6_PAPSO|nr:hypothetical protein C5167_023350 [Papaver somniferum]
MLCNEFDLGFILESVKKTIMGFFFGCFRVKDENQNHHIISDSSNKKNPLVARNRLAVLLLSESQGVSIFHITFFIYLNKVSAGCGAYITCKQEMMQPNASIKDRSAEKTPSSTAWHAVSTGTMFTVYYKPRK